MRAAGIFYAYTVRPYGGGVESRRYDIPDDDGEYIDSMFAELGSMPASGAKDKDMQISNYTKKKVIKGYGKR